MSSKWSMGRGGVGGGYSGIGDIGGGILRKTNPYQNNQTENRGADLLVFGYACKIFRDDEKAIYIDHGKHLIPWMGDKTLKIDRYDVRATLSDLRQYEPPPGGYTNRMDYLTPAEQRAEQLCEEERYYSLYHNEEEEQMYQEEELKRLHQERSSSYGQVQFDYNAANQVSQSRDAEEEKIEEPDEVFTPPPNFDIPSEIELPETMKLHAIIEKTAKFISTQGPQMEILIKAKQSNNPQFEFLNQNNRLNRYYKFILAAFKNDTYPIIDETKNEKEITSNEANGSTDSLNTNEQFQPMMFAYPSVPVPTIKYKPSPNCAYTQLISKIKGVPLPAEVEDEDQNKNDEDKTNVTPFLSYNSYYGQFGMRSQIDAMPVPITATVSAITPAQSTAISNTNAQVISKETNEKNTGDVEVKKISTGLLLAQCYASDTEDEAEHSEAEQIPKVTAPVLDFPIPPDYLQHIIDKTAIYVAKNGKQFEEILRTKQDGRFLFLDSDNEYHRYYMYKVTGIVHPYPTSNGSFITPEKPSKTMNPVSFSIKSKEESTVSIKQVLPQETSDDDDDKTEDKTNELLTIPPPPPPTSSTSTCTTTQNLVNSAVPDYVQIPTPLVENQLVIKGTYINNNPVIGTSAASSSISNIIATISRSRFDVDNTGAVVHRVNVLTVPPVKLETLQQKELKRAEEKVKDRLAQIAREKLGLISKEKQLQLERKKKAMAFLNQIKGTNTTLPQQQDDDSSKGKSENDSDSGSSVHSIPISSVDEKSNASDDCASVTMIIGESLPTKEENTEHEIIEIQHNSRSRSRSRSKSHSHKKKKKSKHSKKKSKKRSHSRSHSHSPSSRDRKRRKRSSSRKAKKRRHDD